MCWSNEVERLPYSCDPKWNDLPVSVDYAEIIENQKFELWRFKCWPILTLVSFDPLWKLDYNV